MKRLTLLATLAGLLLQPVVAQQSTVERDIRSTLSQSYLERARIGLVVRSLDDDREVVAWGADRLLVPASTAKLLTAYTALRTLGPAFEWTTSLYLDGRPSDGRTLEGDLVVVGDGDPNLSGRFHEGDALHVFRSWARDLRSKGLERVTGDLVLDGTAFDRQWVHPDWETADIGRWYAAPVAALSLNDNCVDVRFGPDAAVAVHPDIEYFEPEGRIRTTSSRSEHRLIAWRRGERTLVVEGTRVWSGGSPETIFLPVADPEAHYGAALAHVLAEEGISIEGTVRAAERPVDVSRAFRAAVHTSGMAPTLAVMGKRSQNFYAEQLFKRSGRAVGDVGSWRTGRSAVELAVARLGVGPSGLVAVDGSGLSRDNRVTPRAMMAVLRAAARGPDAGLFFDSLPIAGVDGTLERRLGTDDVRGRVRAKTGTLRGVSGLAGLVEGRSGRYLFVFLGNGPSVGDLRRAQDEVCRILAAN